MLWNMEKGGERDVDIERRSCLQARMIRKSNVKRISAYVRETNICLEEKKATNERAEQHEHIIIL